VICWPSRSALLCSALLCSALLCSAEKQQTNACLLYILVEFFISVCFTFSILFLKKIPLIGWIGWEVVLVAMLEGGGEEWQKRKESEC
jgi:hypothetical protein